MKTYTLDTNIILRFLLKDIPSQYQLANEYFVKAYQGKIRLFLTTQVIFEINYILAKSYSYSKQDIVPKILSLINLKNLTTEDKNLLILTLNTYLTNNLSLVDTHLSCLSLQKNYNLLTFDKKLANFHKKNII